MKNEKSAFYDSDDVSVLENVSKSYAYKLIRKMNQKLNDEGYLVIPGRVPKKFFQKMIYGYESEFKREAN